VLAAPEHVTGDLDRRELRLAERVGEAGHRELESILRVVDEAALQEERLDRSVRVLARPDLRGEARPRSHERRLQLFDVHGGVSRPTLARRTVQALGDSCCALSIRAANVAPLLPEEEQTKPLSGLGIALGIYNLIESKCRDAYFESRRARVHVAG
jgi:hypothetical protein